MFKRIKTWWTSRRQKHNATREGYTREQLNNAYKLGYTDGRRDGLTIAREQATNSLREILKQSNRQPKP